MLSKCTYSSHLLLLDFHVIDIKLYLMAPHISLKRW